jgi:hypothetical protein
MFGNMRMEIKVMCAMVLMTVIVLIVGWVGIFGMNQINKTHEEIARVALPGIIAPEILKDAQVTIQGGERTFKIIKGLLIVTIVLATILSVAIAIRIRRDLKDVFVGLKEEVRTMVQAAVGGKLAARGDPEKVNNEFRYIIKGFNDALDAVIGPLNIAADYMGRISQGKTPPLIRDNYNEDFNLIKNNLNSCISAAVQQVNTAKKLATGDLSLQMQARSEWDISAINLNNAVTILDDLRNEVLRLTKALQEGRFSERGRTEQFQGAYAEIIQGVNRMLNAVLLPIGEGTRLKNNIHTLVADTTLLAKAAAEGDFSLRADAAKHDGDFRMIVAGINEILDCMIEPLKFASEYKERIANCEISPKVYDSDKVDAKDVFFEMIARNKPYL